jgi:D-serine deaminase-like pyridoxal phosphate-dependent protein
MYVGRPKTAFALAYPNVLRKRRHVLFDELATPAALVYQPRMALNIERMQQHLTRLGVTFRWRVKTSKCLQVWKAQTDAGASGITVSILQEAEQFFSAGERDILDGTLMAGYRMSGANREHGIAALTEDGHADATGRCDMAERFPIETKLRISPVYACATGAQYRVYRALNAKGENAGGPRSHSWSVNHTERRTR